MTTVDAITSVNERREVFAVLFRSATFRTGMAIVLFWVTCALFGYQLVPYDPLATDILNALEPPSAEHWFGTDQLGRDIFSRTIVGSRDILTVAPLATFLATVLGTALGLLTGYLRGVVDDVISRLFEAIMAIPSIIVALVAIVALGTSQATVILVIGFSFAPYVARSIRSCVLLERELDYVAAAKLRRENAAYIMFVEILPNILLPVLVELTVRLGYAIFAVATLSFLGFGLQPPSPDWGLSVSTNYGVLSGGYWWPVLFDILSIASLIVAVHLVADSIHGSLDA